MFSLEGNIELQTQWAI